MRGGGNLIRALCEGAGTGLSALLLDSKNRRCYLRRTDASPFLMPAPKMLAGPLSWPPVEMLLHTGCAHQP
jgi:hypothetical protein